MIKKPMQFRSLSRLLVGVVLLSVLAACASPAPAQAPAPASASGANSTVATSAPATGKSADTTTSATAPAAGAAASGATVSFSKDILPIMETTCVSCHGGEKTSKGLDLKSYASLMAGSQNGAVITTGDASGSKLVQSVQSGKMPKRGAKLTAEQIQLLVDWVNAGAANN